jgi:hypothetical protein
MKSAEGRQISFHALQKRYHDDPDRVFYNQPIYDEFDILQLIFLHQQVKYQFKREDVRKRLNS